MVHTWISKRNCEVTHVMISQNKCFRMRSYLFDIIEALTRIERAVMPNKKIKRNIMGNTQVAQ